MKQNLSKFYSFHLCMDWEKSKEKCWKCGMPTDILVGIGDRLVYAERCLICGWRVVAEM
jgi:hypothetical protein